MDENILRKRETAHTKSPVGKIRSSSPLWNRALEKYREELNDDDDESIIDGIGSLDELVAYARTIEPSGSASFSRLGRLGPTLKFVDDFSAVVAICLGANAKITAFVWGSLRLIITLASSADDALHKVLDMLEELSLSLPRFRHYEETLPLDRAFENTLVDLYSEVICFYARLIRYYKDNPHHAMQNVGWQSLQKDFTNTVRRVKHLSTMVEKEADVAKMKIEKDKYDQVLDLLRTFGTQRETTNAAERFYHIPLSMTARFKGRDEDLAAIQQALNPPHKPDGLKSFALYGMGGAGKTQLALKYALDSKKFFDTILWIAADTTLSLEQGFRAAATGLGLTQESESGTSELAATARVKNWLCDPMNERKWLLIFDNADNIDVLAPVWPANGFGSVLITSRDFNTALSPASGGIHVIPFGDSEGSEVLLQLLKINNPSHEQSQAALEIVHGLGGLPLALDQIAGFITQRKMRIQDFLPLYERNASKIDARRQTVTDYPHTLGTVFNMALEQLEGPALHLQNLLAFLEPDSIQESLFLDGHELVLDPDFDFLGDEFDLGDAEEIPLQAALINKDVDERALSVHRLVQVATLRRLDTDSKRKYFSVAIDLLRLGFPDTWSKDVGHQKAQWSRCERYLPHVNNLVGIATKTTNLVDKPDSWAELLLRCSWYLYEKEQYQYAGTFVQSALSNFTAKDSLAYANTVDLLGLIDLDMCKPQKALESFRRGLAIRERLVEPTDPVVAFALNNLAIAYTEIPDLDKAVDCHQKAIDIRLKNNSDRIGNSYSNYAVTLLRLNRPDEAEDILMKCPSLANCTEDTFIQADNPRFVGDMVLLSRIRRAQGRKVDALRLASKALAWRQKVHGDRFKTCDSMYDVATMLHDQNQKSAALDILVQLADIARTLPGGEGHAARAEFKMSSITAELSKEEDSQAHRENALKLRAAFRPQEANSPFDEVSFNRLNMFMLW